MDDFKWDVRARGDGPEGVVVYARSHSFRAGAPLSFDDKHGGITAIEYLIGAVAADLVSGLGLAARRRRVKVDAVEAVASGRLNEPLVYLGVVGADGHPGLETVTVTVYVSTSSTDAEVRAAWDEALARSPVVNSLRRSVGLALEVKTTG